MICYSAQAENPPETHKATGFLDFNYYYDSRDFNVTTINILANLKNRFQYFSLTNYTNSIGTPHNFEHTDYYTEQNLRWAFSEQSPFDLTAQWLTRSSGTNDALRLGFRYRIKPFSELSYSINVHAVQFDTSPIYYWQIEHVYSLNILPQLLNHRAYLSGFLDHNIGNRKNTVVTEHQIGYRLIDALHAVIEYRFNGYLTDEKSGIGYGLQYKIGF